MAGGKIAKVHLAKLISEFALTMITDNDTISHTDTFFS